MDFGKQAQEKLIELGDVNKWIEWMKTKFENEQAELFELAEKEINKLPTSDLNEVEPKWEISFTIVTPSHSIRQNILAAVNKFDRPIKLFKGKDNHTLIIRLLRGNNVPVNDLWNDGWTCCKLFVAALNIGANGIFYWNTVTDVDKFYDEIKDLESGKKLEVRLETRLTFNWQEKKMYLNEQNLHLTFLVYEYLKTIKNPEEGKPIREYLSGLGMLAKTDIHLRLEASALDNFYRAFCEAIQLQEKADSTADLLDLGYHQIEGMLTGREEFDRTTRMAKALIENTALSEPITLTQVIAMKRYCEIYFLTVAVRKQRKDNTLRLIPIREEEVNKQ